ncbi:39S ribosomal protein L17, mitochondrial isoform X2 [Oncorhynchus kisutch]|uniref:39S ribosomal protein L17, mitochondrial isoform X2 n=1 Tax=Oncorhynchus kisutch TaxID=8019 RepID=UPI0009A04486|nr:39S ribosomal protein L17, mitochondrial-like isoform X2 [Oncorhynchus kisutch]
MRVNIQMLISHGRVARKMGLGPESRINMLRNILTGLVRHERIETTRGRADEVQFYAEKEKDLIPKLFKVLAPRFETQPKAYTRMARIPNRENLDRAAMAVLEYKGNPFPPLQTAKRDNELTLLNQLLKGYREQRAQQAAAKVEASCNQPH